MAGVEAFGAKKDVGDHCSALVPPNIEEIPLFGAFSGGFMLAPPKIEPGTENVPAVGAAVESVGAVLVDAPKVDAGNPKVCAGLAPPEMLLLLGD